MSNVIVAVLSTIGATLFSICMAVAIRDGDVIAAHVFGAGIVFNIAVLFANLWMLADKLDAQA